MLRVWLNLNKFNKHKLFAAAAALFFACHPLHAGKLMAALTCPTSPCPTACSWLKAARCCHTKRKRERESLVRVNSKRLSLEILISPRDLHIPLNFYGPQRARDIERQGDGETMGPFGVVHSPKNTAICAKCAKDRPPTSSFSYMSNLVTMAANWEPTWSQQGNCWGISSYFLFGAGIVDVCLSLCLSVRLRACWMSAVCLYISQHAIREVRFENAYHKYL